MPAETLTGPTGSTPDLIALLDARGRRRSPASTKGYKPTRPPGNKGREFGPDPLPIQDIKKLLDACVPQRPGTLGDLSALRLRALIVLLWRTGMRISEALSLEERDLHREVSTILVRHGKGDKRRLLVMDAWGWDQLQPWLDARLELPPGQIFCVLNGPTAGRAMHGSEVRRQFRDVRKRAGVRRRFAPHQLRHSFAADVRKEGDADLLTLSLQLGHSDLRSTQIYLRGIAVDEVLEPIASRRPPMIPLT
jgi:site-specific recombinase XerD